MGKTPLPVRSAALSDSAPAVEEILLADRPRAGQLHRIPKPTDQAAQDGMDGFG